MTDQPDIGVRRVGQFVYELRLLWRREASWIVMETVPYSYVIGARWAQWKARRMIRAALRRAS